MMSRVLEMTFQTESGRNKTIKVTEARADLTDAEVAACMDHIIAKNIFTGTGGSLTAKLKAQVIVSNVEELDLVE